MAIGVTYDEFWHSDPAIVGYAIAAEEARQRIRTIQQDFTAWNTGRYVQLALGVVLSHAFSRTSTAKYPNEPLIGPELDEQLAKQRRERELVKARDEFLAVANAQMLSRQKTNQTGEPG